MISTASSMIGVHKAVWLDLHISVGAGGVEKSNGEDCNCTVHYSIHGFTLCFSVTCIQRSGPG